MLIFELITVQFFLSLIPIGPGFVLASVSQLQLGSIENIDVDSDTTQFYDEIIMYEIVAKYLQKINIKICTIMIYDELQIKK